MSLGEATDGVTAAVAQIRRCLPRWPLSRRRRAMLAAVAELERSIAEVVPAIADILVAAAKLEIAVQDVQVDFAAMQHDLAATRRERDSYVSQLRRMGVEPSPPPRPSQSSPASTGDEEPTEPNP